jgi:hypothetical protein
MMASRVVTKIYFIATSPYDLCGASWREFGSKEVEEEGQYHWFQILDSVYMFLTCGLFIVCCIHITECTPEFEKMMKFFSRAFPAEE